MDKCAGKQMMPTRSHEHTGYTYADCVSLTESRIFCRADSSEHGIWRDRHLIKQAIEILWYAGSMVVFSNGHEVEFTQEDIRQSLLLELDLEKIKSAFVPFVSSSSFIAALSL